MPMHALAGLAKFIKGKGAGGIHIDNRLFQLHYRVTTTMLLGKARATARRQGGKHRNALKEIVHLR